MVLMMMLALGIWTPATAQIEHYYAFNYYCPSTRVVFEFGEPKVLRAAGGMDTLDLKYFEYGGVFCGESLESLSDSSVTTSFVAQTGDVISYYTDLQFYFSNYTDTAYVEDTLHFTIQLINAGSGEVLDDIDTEGLLPFYGVDDILNALVNPDTTILEYYTIPSDYSGLNVALKVDVSHQGIDSLSAICREHFGAEPGKSITDVYDLAVLDSLTDVLINEDATMQKRAGLRNSQVELDFESITVSVAPNPASIQANIQVLRHGVPFRGKVELLLLNPAGKLVRRLSLNDRSTINIDTRGLSAGSYYIVPSVSGRFYLATVMHIVK
jgi:hypothetical protein